MKVYRIWNETKQEWMTSNNNYVGVYLSLESVRRAFYQFRGQQELYRYSKRDFYPDVFKIFEYELTNEKEIVTE